MIMSKRILCARLYGHIAAWGTSEAGDAIRPSGRSPSRGAILGIVSAALGIPRADEDGLRDIANGLQVAVASHGPRRAVEEFRTTQTVTNEARRRFHSRPDALARGKVQTSIARRQHVEDGIWRIFIANREGAVEIDLERIQEAFKNPIFDVYLGRREFPLGLPLDPHIVEGDLKGALDSYPVVPKNAPAKYGDCLNRFYREIGYRIVDGKPWDLTWDAGFPGAPDGGEVRTLIDDPFSRSAWRFKQRLAGLKSMGDYKSAAAPEDLDVFLPHIETSADIADEYMPGEAS